MATSTSLHVWILIPFELLYLLLLTVVVQFRSLIRLLIPSEPKSIQGEIILVTGGAKGIGRLVCHKLVEKEKNLTLVIWDVNEKATSETVLEMKGLGVKNVYAFQVDVSQRAQVEKTARKVRAEIGEVTMLFNNAGIIGEQKASWRVRPEVTEKTFGVNMLAHCWTLREFLPPMIERGVGHVVTTCSSIAFVPFPSLSVYCATKSAIRVYIESVKEEVRRYPSKPNISFTTIYPIGIPTDFIAGVNIDMDRYKFLNNMLTPEFVASEIVEGVLAGKEHIYIPRSARFIRYITDNMPSEVTRKLFDFVGVPMEL